MSANKRTAEPRAGRSIRLTVHGIRLPAQAPPVTRMLSESRGSGNASGVSAAQTVCDDLTGLARQMCYDVMY